MEERADAADPGVEAAVRASFSRQAVMESIAVAAADAFAITSGEERLVATMLATIMRRDTA